MPETYRIFCFTQHIENIEIICDRSGKVDKDTRRKLEKNARQRRIDYDWVH